MTNVYTVKKAMRFGIDEYSNLVRTLHRFGSVGWAFLAAALLYSVWPSDSIAAVRTSDGVNRTIPKVTRPAAELAFSPAPGDSEFLHTGLFSDPLAPVATTTAEENSALAQAVLAYRDAVRERGDIDAVEPLLAFIAAHPGSAWKPALQLNLGLIYRKTGHFSKALDVWQAGWNDARALSNPQGRALATAIVARLSQLEAYLGRKELLEPLLDSIHDRTVGGTAAELITDSHTGLYEMVYHPGESFRCGPLALARILRFGNPQPSPQALKVLAESPSTDHGLSLSAVEQIAERAGMHYQAAFRSPGAPIILPSVAHWNVGHYAAIVDRDANGRYIVQDTTFGEDIRVSPTTVDEESSGYFLVPAGALPTGWRAVSATEGETVWGRGNTGTNHDNGATGCGGSGGSGGSGCTTTNVELEVVGLQLNDTPVGYAPPKGPAVRFKLTYSHRDTQQPTTFSYTNFGPKWTFNWLSYITDTVNTNAQALVYLPGGGNEPFTFNSTSAKSAYPGPYSQAILTRTVNGSGASTGFTLTFPDGSYELFQQPSGNQFFMTGVSDPAGNLVLLTYDSQMRIVAVEDAIGQVSTISYGLSGSPLVVTEITDPFGRSAIFTYNGNGQLASITDVLGITSAYSYGEAINGTTTALNQDFINTLTTPYGSTTFTYGDSSTNPNLGSTRFLTTVDPLNRTSYVEFDQGIDAGDTSAGVMINPNLIPAGMYTEDGYLNWRNTFVFDANQYQQATAAGGLNYSLARVIHWLHTEDMTDTSRVMESEKQPLENRVWYNYPNDSNPIVFLVNSGGVVVNGASNRPSAIGRVLDSGQTQLQTFQYNSNGNVTQVTDAVGRQWTYTYAANGIDRLTTSNTTSGTQLLETRAYNSQHLPLTILGANGETSHFAYNVAGQPTRYTDPLGHATTLTYDGSGHLKTVTGPINSAEYSLAYDNVSRIASVTDPSGGTIHYSYDTADRLTTTTYPDGSTGKRTYTLLDLTSFTDRLHQVTHYSYDADRELISTTDALGHKIQQGYNAAGHLTSITDANEHTTGFVLDDESRITTKQFANGASARIFYENATSRVASLTDALSQTKDYTYNSDNTIATVSYDASQATPSVSFTYDPIYLRITGMTDGVGTTTFSYYPVSTSPVLGANQLQSVISPIAGTTATDTVQYSYDALNRVAGLTVNGVTQLYGYDALGRITSEANRLDSFSYSYNDGTWRVAGVSSNTGPTTALTYFGPTGSELLEKLSVSTQSGGTSLAQFGYTYNADENEETLAVTSPIAQTTTYGYDAANRLVSAQIGSGSPQYVYGYDNSSNLTSITPDGTTESLSYTSTNAIKSATYDSNGSPLVLSGNSYKWDGENRLVRFASTANNTGSSFTYDGLGRLVRVVDTHGGAVTADHSYTWCGPVRCLAHDNTQSGSPVSSQYFDQGAIISGTAYYYVEDQLGSVTQLVTSGGTVAAQYTYDPYGNRTVVSGTVVADVGYAGYFYHGVSGLEFAMYRAYDPTHGRWLNRDPISEAGGINLYAYTFGDPVDYNDPSGEFLPLLVILPAIGGLINGIADVIAAGPCQNPWAAFGRGFVSGALGTLAGIGITTLTANPVLAGAGAGEVTSIIDQALEGGPINPVTVAESTVLGGIGGKLLSKVFPTVGQLPSLTLPRTLDNVGLNSLRLMSQEGGSDVGTSTAQGILNGIQSPSGGTGCGCNK